MSEIPANSDINATLINRAWRRVDIKICVGEQMHVLRWRRGWFIDEVLFDERRVATSSGLFGRDTIFGMNIKVPSGEETRLLLTIDPESDWTDWEGTGRPRGVRLETAGDTLFATGSLKDRAETFKALFDRAVEAVGLS